MKSFERKVLVLDSRFEATKIVSLEVGFILLYSNRAISIEDSDRTLKSVNSEWAVPWIIRLLSSCPKQKYKKEVRFSRQNIYIRDNFRCQYCQKIPEYSNLTLDHVLPLARGGKTTWDNIVTACKNCNIKKGARTIEELGIKISRPQLRPNFHKQALFPVRYGLFRENAPQSWLPYLDFSIADRVFVHEVRPNYDINETSNHL